MAQEPEDIFSSQVRPALYHIFTEIYLSSFFQVDGSSDSLNSDRTTFQAQFTMRECEEQITTLKKENFNLKLRIYFMEESQGLLHSPKEQAELYKVNIDLKVKSEELKKVTYCMIVLPMLPQIDARHSNEFPIIFRILRSNAVC